MKLTPLVTIALVVGAFFGLLFLYKVTVALGMVSLTLTVLGGTDFVKNKFQYLKLPGSNNQSDVWTVCSVAVAITGTAIGIWKREFSCFEGISYSVLIVFLCFIMYKSAKMHEAKKKAP